jgi:hypothetical protein
MSLTDDDPGGESVWEEEGEFPFCVVAVELVVEELVCSWVSPWDVAWVSP